MTPLMTPTPTLAALRQVRSQRYLDACRNGTIAMIETVVTELGVAIPKRHGAHVVWTEGRVQIMLDTHTNAMAVKAGDRVVCSTASTSRFFVAGPWLGVVEQAAITARARVIDRREQREREARALLLLQLGVAPPAVAHPAVPSSAAGTVCGRPSPTLAADGIANLTCARRGPHGLCTYQAAVGLLAPDEVLA
jgi:hypothetical protein